MEAKTRFLLAHANIRPVVHGPGLNADRNLPSTKFKASLNYEDRL